MARTVASLNCKRAEKYREVLHIYERGEEQ